MIATGGTGGHIYPAIALAQQLINDVSGCQVLFVGGGLSDNRYFDQGSFPSCTVDCGAFVDKSPAALLKSCTNILKGIYQSRSIIRKFQPDVAVGFGSFYSFPPLVAAKLQSVPLILHEANSIPGKVIRLMAPWAAATGVHFPQTTHLLKGKIIEVGMPLREGFRLGAMECSAAREYYGLHQDLKTLLVFGGSQGAQYVNEKVQEALQLVPHRQKLQVIHIAGDLHAVEGLQKNYANAGIPACVKPFEQRMDIAWQAADVVVCRAGASTVAEQLEFEVPGILIPFPRAADNHQECNADFMASIVGGGVKLKEQEVHAARLAECLTEFFDGAILGQMKKAMSHYKKSARANDLCSLVKSIL